MRKVKNFLSAIFNSEELIHCGEFTIQILLIGIALIAVIIGVAFACSKISFILNSFILLNNIVKWVFITLLVIVLVFASLSIVVYLYNCLKYIFISIFRKS